MIDGYKIAALCITNLFEEKNHEFMCVLNEALKDHGYRIFVYHMCSDLYYMDDKYNAESAVFELIDFDKTDALIIAEEEIKNRGFTSRFIEKARANGIPVICIDGDREDCINVRFDFETGFELVVRHVVEHHHAKTVHYIGGFKGNEFSEKRKEVVRKVMAENGLPFDESMVSYGDFWADPTKLVAKRIIDSGNIPDAVICANDIMAINAAAVFKERGFDIPGDVIVTGFDGIDEIFFSVPRMTSAKCSYTLLAQKVAELVIKSGGGENVCGEHLVEPSLLLSESCGCKDSLDPKQLSGYLNNLTNRFFSFRDNYRELSLLSENIQTSDNIEAAISGFSAAQLWGMSVVINKSNTDNSHRLRFNRGRPFESKMFLMYDAASGESFKQRDMNEGELVPNISEKLERGFPLIFNVISYLQIPLGYICFYYDSYHILHYGKIMNIVLALGSGIGAFVDMQYQRYLAYMVEEMYMLDSLTGLYNRMGFSREYQKVCGRVKTGGGKMTVVLADLDGLKTINDSFGHNAGDNAITTTAKALKHICSKNGICVRFGGDEMLAVIDGSVAPELLREKFDSFLDKYNETSGLPYEISASLGIFEASAEDDLEFENIIKRSDELMYAEKLRKRAARA